MLATLVFRAFQNPSFVRSTIFEVKHRAARFGLMVEFCIYRNKRFRRSQFALLSLNHWTCAPYFGVGSNLKNHDPDNRSNGLPISRYMKMFPFWNQLRAKHQNLKCRWVSGGWQAPKSLAMDSGTLTTKPKFRPSLTTWKSGSWDQHERHVCYLKSKLKVIPYSPRQISWNPSVITREYNDIRAHELSILQSLVPQTPEQSVYFK